LLVISYFFYGLIDWRFPILLLALTAVNFIVGNRILVMDKPKVQKRLLTFAIVISLLVLFYFKYANFFIDQITSLFGLSVVEREEYLLKVLMPIGLSFITFQAITYPIDCYRKQITHPTSLLNFSLFMAFFPQILSGPIVRASYFIPQLEDINNIDSKLVYEGFWQIIRGLIKKIIIADTLAYQIVNPAFASPDEFSSLFLVLAIFTFSIQIYMDLSGYTDIALGLAKMLGYKLPINFNRPYLATSIANYWQRWHISMSSFFRDYLYYAIERWSWCNIYIKLVIIFVAIGFWHGAGWNFLLYGAIHGSLVAYEHYNKLKRATLGKPPFIYRGTRLVVQIMKIFTIVAFTRILFRGDDLGSSYHFIYVIFNTTSDYLPLSSNSLLILMIAIIMHVVPTSWRDNFTHHVVKLPVLVSASLATFSIYLMIAFSNKGASFIYFQF
jgi:D-alanyl-lipoteichoic acid acyltransferase DltB (MBOAT superfamily)